MTATAAPSPAARLRERGAAARIGNVVRLHLANPATVLLWPLGILAAIFVANLAIWAIIALNVSGPDYEDAVRGMQWSGASTFIFVYMMVVAVQAMNQTFGFALGMSVTRRDYFLGSAAAFAALSVVYAVVLSVLGEIEAATGGWGLGGRMFTAVYFGDGSFGQRLFTTFAFMVFFFFVGSAVAAVYARWRARGLSTFFIALGFVLVGLVALLTFTDSWGLVGAWIAANGAAGVAAWSFAASAISAVGGFLLLRRATPRS
jgi:hypothetical protein